MPGLQVAIDAAAARRGAGQFDRAGNRIISTASRIDRSVSRIDGRMGKFGKTMQVVGGIMSGAFLGSQITRVLRGITSAIVQFQDTLNTVRVVASATEEEFAALNETARFMGATTRFSAKEAGDGMLFLARAGFDVNQNIAAIPATLNLAAAGAIELGQAADFASNILTAFKLDASEMDRVANVLVNTANSANTNIVQLAEGMRFAAPVAGQLGISIEEAAALIGVLGDSGIQASLAGTGFRKIMLSLVGPTEQAAKALEELGIQEEEAEERFKGGLIQIFERLKDGMFSAKDAMDIFGVRATSAALVVADGINKMQELTQANIEASDGMGAAARAAEGMSDDIEGAWKNLVSVSQELVLQLGDAGVSGALRAILDTATDVGRVLAGLEEHVQGNRQLAETIARGIKLMTLAGGAFIALKLPGVLLATAAAMKALTIAMATNPFGIAAIAISLATVAIMELQDETVQWGDTVVELGDVVKASMDYISALWDAMTETVTEDVNWLILQAERVGEWFRRMSQDRLYLEEGQRVPLVDPDALAKFRAERGIASDGIPETGVINDLVLARKNQRRLEERLEAARTKEGLQGAGLVQERVDQLRNAQEQATKMVEAQDDILSQIERETYALEDELSSMRFVGRERELEIERLRLQRIAGEQNNDAITAAIDKHAEMFASLQRMRQLDTIAQGIGQSFADAFTDMVIGARSAAEAMEDLARSIAALVVQQTIAQPIAAGISSLILSPFTGGVPAFQFAKGGVIGGPTFYRDGLVGEAGPEAVLPLRKMGDGTLGVGGNSGGVTVQMTVNTADANSFRASTGQILSELTSRLRGL
jgi:TP901 family phage tail tape measure protein